ncbi:hypothetical protein CAP31_12550 [Sulfuriferula sp. AH1]|uniref:hypothetical protein n=1 Tax=Sulfuriferula sp. AH1 TaxID=1985873 RepID=UPI000B3B3F11|nr:hypothetical protein [Sulfuriferula sp. AH1]ARU32433.1 hypothetical protein CAP31_12550 [Sulfuriferula sp. AH1]
MKFQHLPIGAHFEFEGRCYTKVGPLVAAEEGGGQRMIPRYAVLRGLNDVAAAAAPITVPQLEAAEVSAAFAEFEQLAGQMLHEATNADPARQAAVQAALTVAGQVFRNRLNIK